MPRIILTLLIWIVFPGLVVLFFRHRDAARHGTASAVRLQVAPGSYALELTPSFDAAADPFALRTADDDAPTALRVQLGGREILRMDEGIHAGTPIRIEPIPGLVLGANELHIQATPPVMDTAPRHMVHILLLRDGIPVEESFLWSEGGAPTSGAFRFDLSAD